MKKYLIAILTCLVSTFGVYSQTGRLELADIDKRTIEIKTDLLSYNKFENYKDSSGYTYLYKKNHELKAVMLEYKDSREPGKYIDKKVEWYFHAGHLIYCETTWTDIVTGLVVGNEKCYLNEKHLIEWIKTGNYNEETDSKDFHDADIALITYGNKLVRSNY